MQKDANSDNSSDRLPKALFFISLSIMVFAFGYSANKYKFFPYSFIEAALAGFSKVESTARDVRPWFYRPTPPGTKKIQQYDPERAHNALSLITAITADKRMVIRIIDMDGTTVHEWPISWLEQWPNSTHVPEMFLPKEEPGTHIHGAVLMDNGDVVFNFEHLGLMRLNPCNEVVWRLPYRTHHSIHKSDNGNLWVSAQIDHYKPPSILAGYNPPYIEPMILEVSPDGEILTEKSVISLLQENEQHSLLYMTSGNGLELKSTGDTLHLNDIEVFSTRMPEGIFKTGDIMISLRNIHAILVFDKDWKLKYKSIGNFLRQHDPDFIDGNTFSIYDNNNLFRNGTPRHSRILLESADQKKSKVYFQGTKEKSFYSVIMGKHQWLPNGNLLVTDSMAARAFELDGDNNVVWEFTNIVDSEHSGILEEVTRLPAHFNTKFFENARQLCSKK